MFKIPRKYLVEEYRLFVPIGFEWEAIETITINDGVEHRVYLDSSVLITQSDS